MRHELLEAIVSRMPDAVLVTDDPAPGSSTGPVILYVNEAFERLTGYARADVLGRTPRVLEDPGTDPATLGRLRDAVTARRAVEVTLRARRRDGSPFWTDLALSPVDAGGERCWIAVHREAARPAAGAVPERFSQAVLDSMPAQTCVIDPSGTIVLVNAQWSAFATANGGAAGTTGVGSDYLEACRRAMGPGGDLPADVLCGLQDLLAGRRDAVDVLYPCHSPEHERWYRMSAVPLVQSGGGAVISHTDITHEVLAERRAAALSLERAAVRDVATAVAHQAPTEEVATLTVDRVRETLDAGRVELVVRTPSGFATLAGRGLRDPALTRLLHMCCRRAEQQTSAVGLAVPILAAGEVWGALGASAMAPAGESDRLRVLQSFADLLTAGVQHQTSVTALERQASTDPLTGLANHRTLQERIREEIQRARRHQRSLSLAILDVDRFKAVNDNVGHQRGDRVLVAIADHLRSSCRAEDVIGRIGGDEFAILLPDTDAVRAFSILERARVRIAARPIVDDLAVTVSAGVCDLATAGDAESLLAFADGALYWSKAHGRDATWIYDPEVVRELSASERAEQLQRSQGVLGLRALARAIDAKDRSTRRHSERVADLGVAIARRLGWQGEEVELLREACLVHDVGKIGIPDAVLLKPGRLAGEEIELVRSHAALGARIVEDVLRPEQVAWIRAHHERPDRLGYPDGLGGDAIPEGARIIAVADAFDVMTSDRPYRAAMEVDEALVECRGLAGAQFDRRAVTALEHVVRDDPALTAGSRAAS